MIARVVTCCALLSSACADPDGALPSTEDTPADGGAFMRPDVPRPPPAWRDASVADASPAPDVHHEPGWMGPILLTTRTALYTFDPATRAVRHLADYHVDGQPLTSVVDIALTADHRLLLGTEEHRSADLKTYRLFEADAATGEARLLYEIPNGLIGLEVADEDVVVTGGFGLMSFELGSGELVGAVPGTTAHRVSGDVVLMPDQTLLYSVFDDRSPSDLLYRYRPGAAAPERVGEIGLRFVWGLVQVDGALWAFTQEGEAARLDPDTAAVLERHPLGVEYWYGATRAR